MSSSSHTSFYKPSLILLIFMAGLPQIGETIYSPALPSIANDLGVSHSMIETTLTIYLIGFAVGVLFWGRLSDQKGRRPIMLIGFLLYCIGSVGCLLAPSFWILFGFRFIQSFGGSVGSVISQTIARDVFEGKARAIAFSTVAMALSFSPILGPVIGGFVDDYWGWRMIFLVLLLSGVFLEFYIYKSLKETRPPETHSAHFLKILPKMIKDPVVLSFGILAGGLNGLLFVFIAEGPFYLIDLLGIRPSLYGVFLFFTALSFALGSVLSRILLHRGFSEKKLILTGCFFCLISSFSLLIFAYCNLISPNLGIFASFFILGPMIGVFFGIAFAMALCLSHALKHYLYAAGTAGSLFGCFYYTIISGLTAIMAIFHNGSVYPMPWIFVIASLIMMIVAKQIIYPHLSREEILSPFK